MITKKGFLCAYRLYAENIRIKQNAKDKLVEQYIKEKAEFQKGEIVDIYNMHKKSTSLGWVYLIKVLIDGNDIEFDYKLKRVTKDGRKQNVRRYHWPDTHRLLKKVKK